MVWEMAEKHWVATTREAFNRIYGNGETVRDNSTRVPALRGQTPDACPEAGQQRGATTLGLLLIAREDEGKCFRVPAR